MNVTNRSNKYMCINEWITTKYSYSISTYIMYIYVDNFCRLWVTIFDIAK